MNINVNDCEGNQHGYGPRRHYDNDYHYGDHIDAAIKKIFERHRQLKLNRVQVLAETIQYAAYGCRLKEAHFIAQYRMQHFIVKVF